MPPQRRTLLGLAGLLLAAAAGVARAEVAVPAAVKAAEAERIAVMQRVAPSVVAVFASDGKGGGSGVLIDAEGYAVTNFHVVQGLGGFMKCGLNDGRSYDAVLVGIDPTGDVALIKLLGRDDFPFAEIGDSDHARVGDRTFAMGNPFLLATDFQPTVTYGMISGVHRYQYPAGTFLEYTDCLQVDASINPGNSGGPLFSADGKLIGINGRISVEKRGRVNVGAGYAISINQVMNFLDHLKSGRIVDHATLGATVRSTSDGAVVVANILESSPAFRRGLRHGDELVSFAGRPVRSVNQFKNVLGIYPKGWPISITIARDSKRLDLEVRLMGLHRQAELVGGPPMDSPEGGPPDPEEEGPKRPPEEPKEHFGTKKAVIPEQHAHLFEERPGFANYRFNANHQDRLRRHLERWGTYANQPDGWAWTGAVNGAPAEIRLLPEAAVARIDGVHALQDLADDFADIPAGTGGLLAAFVYLKHFLGDPADYFTEFYYLGTEPLSAGGPRVDVLISTRGLSIGRWYFDRDNGDLIGLDLAVSEDADPCELRFSRDLASIGDVRFPAEIAVSHAGEPWGTLTTQSLQFFTPPAATGGKP